MTRELIIFSMSKTYKCVVNTFSSLKLSDLSSNQGSQETK
jgi:hypothetical protein